MIEIDNYDHWCQLNEEGMRRLGTMFPDGIVPVKSFIQSGATLEGQEGVKKVFLIDIDKLTQGQLEACLDFMANKSGADKEIIRHDIVGMGYIPLQDKWVSGSGTRKIGMLL